MEVSKRVALKASHFEPENEKIEKYTLADDLPAKMSELVLHRSPDLSAPGGEKSTEQYDVKSITAQDKEAVLEFLRTWFFHDEPMNEAVQLLETADSRCVALEEYATSSLDEGTSFAAVDHNGDIVGLIINGISQKEDREQDANAAAEQCPDAKFARVLRVLAHLEREAREQLGAGRVLEVRIVSTHPAWRGRGLMSTLCRRTEKLAKELGCDALRMDTTSAFSAAAAERLRYTRIYTVPYADLPAAPRPKPPHTHASVYVKNI